MNEIDRQLIKLARGELEESKKKYDSACVITGDPAAGISAFNAHIGSDGEPSEGALTEDATRGSRMVTDLKPAYNDAVKCAQAYHKPVIYGYFGTDHRGRRGYYTFDDPIICDDLQKCSADVMKKYHPAGSILVAYPDRNVVESAYCGDSLEEEKRYVRRYYIKPHNIFCSNKAEVLQALIEHENEDCVVYTLLNLGDEKDIAKLTSDDVIYYYEDLVLYDKNHVRVMDYDLAIKHEENREKLNPDKVSDAKLADVYSDRMTELTELDEDADIVKGDECCGKDDICEAKDGICCICGGKIDGYGNNAEPYAHGRCCDACNFRFVIPARLDTLEKEHPADESLNEELPPKISGRFELSKDFSTLNLKKAFAVKWTRNLNGKIDRIPSMAGKKICVHTETYDKRGDKKRNDIKANIIGFGYADRPGPNDGNIFVLDDEQAEGVDADSTVVRRIDGFFGKVQSDANKREWYWITTEDTQLNSRLDIFKEARKEAIGDYVNKATAAVDKLSSEEIADAKSWILDHIVRMEYRVPAAEAGYTKDNNGEIEEPDDAAEYTPVDSALFRKYANKFKTMQLRFERLFPAAKGMQPGETRTIGKNLTVKYVPEEELKQRKLSHYGILGPSCIVTFDVNNSEMPESMQKIVEAARNDPEASKLRHKDEIFDMNSNTINSAPFANRIMILFDGDPNFMAQKKTSDSADSSTNSNDFFNAF